MKDFKEFYKHTKVKLDVLTKKDFSFYYDDMEFTGDADYKKSVTLDEGSSISLSFSVVNKDNKVLVLPMMYIDFTYPFNEGIIFKVGDNRYSFFDEEAIELDLEDPDLKDKVFSYLNEFYLGSTGIKMLKEIASGNYDVSIRVGETYSLNKRQIKVLADFYNYVKELNIEAQPEISEFDDAEQFTCFNK